MQLFHFNLHALFGLRPSFKTELIFMLNFVCENAVAISDFLSQHMLRSSFVLSTSRVAEELMLGTCARCETRG